MQLRSLNPFSSALHHGVQYQKAFNLRTGIPHLGQQAVVPVDVVGVEPQLALLLILLDGVALLTLSVHATREGGGDK